MEANQEHNYIDSLQITMDNCEMQALLGTERHQNPALCTIESQDAG